MHRIITAIEEHCGMKKNGDAVALYHLHTVVTGWAKKTAHQTHGHNSGIINSHFRAILLENLPLKEF